MKTFKQEYLKFVLLHNFSKKEISLIMSRIKSIFSDSDDRKKIVFAKKTEHSKKMKVAELIEDASEDHLYLLENPPQDFSEAKK